MISAAFSALGDLLSRDFRSVLFKAIGMTLALFIAILIGVEVLLTSLTLIPWAWAETLAAIGAGPGAAGGVLFHDGACHRHFRRPLS